MMHWGIDLAPDDEEREIDNLLEALTNLFYLIGSVEPGSTQQNLYLEMAEEVVNRAVERRTLLDR